MAEKDLMSKFKESIGDFSDDKTLESFYRSQLDIAYADLISEDISEKVLSSPIGHSTQILYAQLLLEKKDVATNPNLTFLRNKLCSMTQGERAKEEK